MIETKDRERGIGAWEVIEVSSSQFKREVYLKGLNHFETFRYGEPVEFFWRVGYRSFEDIERAKKVFDFAGARFEDGAMDIFISICGGKAKADEILNHKHTTKDRR